MHKKETLTQGALFIEKHYVGESTLLPPQHRIAAGVPGLKAREIQLFAIQDNVRFAVHELLPNDEISQGPAWKIVEAAFCTKNLAYAGVSPDNKMVIIPSHTTIGEDDVARTYIYQPGAMLSLLHEIGHANRPSPCIAPEHKAFLERLNNPFGFITKKEAHLHRHYVLRPEMEAWQYALNIIEEQRQKLLDLEPLQTMKELRSQAAEALSSYRRKYFDL